MIELITNDRVIGGMSSRCAGRAAELYGVFTQGAILTTDATTAEVSKLAENAYRDVNIAFANELAMVCDTLGIDVPEVIDLANRHPRVGILQPGPGVGGHCIAVDPWFLIGVAPDRAPLMRTARAVNSGRPSYIIEQVSRTAERFREPVIACLGLAFKANVDDLRESPALEVAEALSERSIGSLFVVEPHIDSLPPTLGDSGSVKLVDLDQALGEADIVVLLVDHDEFRGVKRTALRGKVIFDTRGLWR